MKKILAGALILALFWLSNTTMVPVRAPPVVWNVPFNFPTITAALASGQVNPGDTIHVWNGFYTEDPTINIQNIKIIGQSPGGVIIQHLVPGLPCISIVASGVTIMELEIRGLMVPGDVGILISPPASGCKIINNYIFDCDYGIWIINSPKNEIVGNQIDKCRVRAGPPPGLSAAIYLLGPGSTNNAIRGNEIGLTGPNNIGVEINAAIGNTITFNNFYGSLNFPEAFTNVPGANLWQDNALGKGNFWNGVPSPYLIPLGDIDVFGSPGNVPYNWAAIPWDINRDCRCNIIDVATAAIAFGSQWSMLNWNPKADLTGDGKIDIRDIARIAIKFGWTDP